MGMALVSGLAALPAGCAWVARGGEAPDGGQPQAPETGPEGESRGREAGEAAEASGRQPVVVRPEPVVVARVERDVVGESAAPAAGPGEMPAPLRAIVAMRGTGRGEGEAGELFGGLRTRAVREAAMAIAMQSAVRWRYARINERLEAEAARLDRLFDFRPLLLAHGRVVPPVVVEARAAIRVESERVATVTGVTYRIERAARVTASPPGWRGYLVERFAAAESVNAALLPADEAEVGLWREAALSGWRAGVEQAERVFRARLARLARDFRGMVRYRVLAGQGVIAEPVVAASAPAIEAGAERLDVGRQVVRITRAARFAPPERWRAKVAEEEEE